jgi:hypothetical protein
MLRQVLSLILSASLVGAALSRAGYAQTNSPSPTQVEEFKRRVVEWGTNRNVSVKLKSGDKLKGRIAEIKDEYFAVQFVDKGQVTTREVPYADVKSISAKGKGGAGKTVAYAALGAAAGVLIIYAIAFAIYND